MQITPAILRALYTSFSLAFQKGYGEAQPWWPLVAGEMPSTTKLNTYGWMERIPTMRKWIGPREAANLKSRAYQLANDPYELTVEVDRDDIEDDDAALGIYQQQIMPEFGRQVRKHPDQLITQIVKDNTILAYDGKTLFATDHVIGNSSYSNSHNLALTADNFNTVWSTMVGLKGEDDQPLGVMPNLLLHAPQLRKTALEVVQSEQVAKVVQNVAGSENVAATVIPNVQKGWAEPVMIQEWADSATRWVLVDTTKAIKPFIYQLRRAANFVARDRPDDPKVFDLKKFTYGTDGRWAVGISLPWLIARGKA